jgi:hypothetical protein
MAQITDFQRNCIDPHAHMVLCKILSQSPALEASLGDALAGTLVGGALLSAGIAYPRGLLRACSAARGCRLRRGARIGLC